MRILVVIEDVGRREFSRGHRDARHVDRRCDPVGAVLDRLLGAAQAEGLAQEEARDIGLGRVEAGFPPLAGGESGDTGGPTHAEALVEPRIEIELAAFPGQPPSEKRGAADGLARLAAAGQAVGPAEWRMEAGIALPHAGRLEMQAPRGILGPGRRGGVARFRRGAPAVRPKQACRDDSKRHPPSLTGDVPSLFRHARTLGLWRFIAWPSARATASMRASWRVRQSVVAPGPGQLHRPPAAYRHASLCRHVLQFRDGASANQEHRGLMRLLVVEDNNDLAQLLLKGLGAEGFAADVVTTAAEGRAALATTRYAAVMLDLGLPDGDGLAVLRELRERKDATPVLVLTARGGVHDRVAGLRSGADDYLAKPFAFEELVARVQALLRRPGDLLGLSLRFGNVTLDTVAQQVFIDDVPKAFSAREVAVLAILMRRSGRVMSKKLVVDSLFGLSIDIGSNAVEVYIHRLRKQLAEAGANLQIHTIRGVGYLISGPSPALSDAQRRSA